MGGGGDSGGGGGGGGGSGAMSWPTYMQNQHQTWLTAIASEISSSTSPYMGVNAYDPDDWLDSMLAALDSLAAVISEYCSTYLDINALKDAVHGFELQVEGLNVGTSWGTFVDIAQAQLDSLAITEGDISTDVTNYGTVLANEIASSTTPRFQAGMQNINAVLSSAFVIGLALINSDKDIQVAKYQSGLRLKAWELNAQFKEHRNSVAFQAGTSMLDAHLKNIEMYRELATTIFDIFKTGTEFKRALTALCIEVFRYGIIAKKEEADENLRIDVADAKWDLEKYQYGANLLAGIGGGTYSPEDSRKSATFGTVLGGAMMGAASGAMIGAQLGAGGGPIGMGIGAVVGAGAALFR